MSMSLGHDKEAFAYLGILDRNCNSSLIHQGYVLNKQNGDYDTTPLFDALTRVTDKWRLLAGRVELDEQGNNYRVRIPLGELHKPAFKFTTAKYDEFIQSPPPSQSYVTTRPNVKYFRPPSTPTMLSKFASLDHPLISVHVSTLNNATCIGICFPHGVFDAIGGSFVLKAIDAELSGRNWVPPPQPDYNAVNAAFAQLSECRDPVEPRDWWKWTFEIYAPATFIYVFKFLAQLLFEIVFRNAVHRYVFLDKDATHRLVDKVKAQAIAQTDGKKWVSTGDVILAWFLKSLFASSRDTNTRGIAVVPSLTFRELLEPRDSTFSAYPHNCTVSFSLPKLSSSTIKSASLADLALMHRDRLKEARTFEYMKQIGLYFQSLNNKPFIVHRRWKDFTEPTLLFTNHTIAGLADIDFGQEMTIEAFWQWIPPIIPDNMFIINKFKDGYTISGPMRKYRWDAVEKEVERINAGGDF